MTLNDMRMLTEEQERRSELSRPIPAQAGEDSNGKEECSRYMSEGVCRRRRGDDGPKLCMELARLAGEPDTVGK